MSAIFYEAALPGFGRFRTGALSTHSHTSKQRQSRRSVLGSVLSLIRKPALTVEKLIAELRPLHISYSASYGELEAHKQVLHLTLRNAATYKQWQEAAVELDELEGNNAWKYEVDSSEYNSVLVNSRLEQLDEARFSRDATRMLFLIRTSLTRHLGAMGDIRLYKHSHIGTKDLIERYIASALETVSLLLEITHTREDNTIDSRHLLEQVLAARQSFGRSALLLSGGGTFGMNHIGVVKCLWETTLLPRILSGSSAGSIVGAVLCTRTDEEIPQVLEDFIYGDLEVFHKTGEEPSLLQQVTRFLKHGSLFDISNLVRVMRDLLGDITFQEAYNRTRRILNICVSSASLFELPRLLNYVTAPNVIIWSAVAASCSVPFVFSPASLLAKDPRTGTALPWNPSPQRWVDGSVDNDLPMTRLAEMFNVNHFIVSQVNPHVIPFLAREEDIMASEALQPEVALVAGPGWLSAVAGLARDEAMHRMHVLSELGICPNILTKTRSVLSQRYSGDITILPEVPYSQFPKVLKNPTTDFMRQATLCGERATWPKLSRIQNHCAIELALDDAVQQLRARIAFSPSQVDLRLNAIARPRSRAGSDSAKSKLSHGQRKRLKYSRQGKIARSSTHSGGQLLLAQPISKANSSQAMTLAKPSLATPQPPRNMPFSFQLSLKPPSSKHHSSDEEQDGVASSSTLSASDVSDTVDDFNDNELITHALTQEDPQSPTLWPSTRQLFPYATQPTTPYICTSRSSSYFGWRSPPPLRSPLATPVALTMTSSIVPGRRSTFEADRPR